MQALLEDAQNSLRLHAMESQRTLTKQQKEHELKIQSLLRQASERPASRQRSVAGGGGGKGWGAC